MNQENILNSLVFNDLKQKPRVGLITTLLNILMTQMGVIGISSSELSSVSGLERVGMSASDTVVPALVRFASKEVARKIFSQKSESFTKRRRDFLNAARDRFGVKHAWTARGNMLRKSPGEPSAQRIKSLGEYI